MKTTIATERKMFNLVRIALGLSGPCSVGSVRESSLDFVSRERSKKDRVVTVPKKPRCPLPSQNRRRGKRENHSEAAHVESTATSTHPTKAALRAPLIERTTSSVSVFRAFRARTRHKTATNSNMEPIQTNIGSRMGLGMREEPTPRGLKAAALIALGTARSRASCTHSMWVPPCFAVRDGAVLVKHGPFRRAQRRGGGSWAKLSLPPRHAVVATSRGRTSQSPSYGAKGGDRASWRRKAWGSAQGNFVARDVALSRRTSRPASRGGH
jgi:hypothetical protein